MGLIHNTIKAHREKLKLTQKDLAKHLGLKSTDRISRWENGLKYPHVVNLIQLARLFGVHAEELYPGE